MTRGALLAMALAAVVGGFTLDGEFVLDDGAAIVASPVVTGQVPAGEALTRDFWGQPLATPQAAWRPLMPLVWRGLWAVGQGEPWPFRALSLLLHVGLVLAAWRLVARVAPSLATPAAALLAVHPARSEAVGALVAQADLLALALGCVAARLALDGRALRGATVLLVACLAKETAVLVLPLVALALWRERPEVRAVLRSMGPLALVAVAVVVVHLALPKPPVMPQDNLAMAAEGATRLLHGLATIGRAVWLVTLPLALAPHHGYAGLDLSLTTLAPWAALGLSTLGVLTWGLRTAAAPFAALALANLVLQSSLLLALPTDVAERLLLPTVLAASVGLSGLAERAPRPRLAAAALVVVFLPLSWAGQRPWTTESTLWEHALLTEPRAMRTQRNASAIAFREGRTDDGLWHLMVLRHLERQLPQPVDWELVDGLAHRPDRVTLGPGAFAPEGPCDFALEWLNGAFRIPEQALEQWGLFQDVYGCPPLR